MEGDELWDVRRGEKVNVAQESGKGEEGLRLHLQFQGGFVRTWIAGVV